MAKKKVLQPEINIGLVGHVDHGKTTLVSKLSGKWTDTHSEEIKRGITIRLGYANAMFYKCKKCKGAEAYCATEKCPNCKGKCDPIRKVSFVDAPGHETLMATMLSGSAIMDCAILMVAANEECPQPQTKEHLMALDICGIKNIIIIQNKIDLVSSEQAKKNYEQIKKFVKGTFAEKAPIIPLSAQLGINVDALIEVIENNFKTPKRDLKKSPILFIARSFDINKPSSPALNIMGGIIGGALVQGQLKIGEEVEICPGEKVEKEGKVFWEPIRTKILGLKTGNEDLDEAIPGGSIAVLTELDPYLVKSDSLTGNLLGHPGKLPPVWTELMLEGHLLERIIGADKDMKVDPIKKGETLMLNVNSTATVGIVTELSKKGFKVTLKKPICAEKTDKITMSRLVTHRFRLIGYATILE
ncbi:MAG: translation initiation factor IF-2 subunit gamma [archaeon]